MLKNIVASIAIALLSTAGFSGHASATNMSAHEMGGVHHESNSGVSCMVQCQTGVMAKSDDVSNEKKKEHDETAPPQVRKNQQIILEEKLIAPQQNALDTAPSEPPGYILYGVFRT